MKFHSLRRFLVTGVLAFVTAVLVGSCGGGGAGQTTQGGTSVAILPSTGSIYAGVPHTFTLVGGRAPYTVASSEPSLLSVPTTVTGNSFTVIANNPGVVDPGQTDDQVPSRTVTIQVRDSAVLGIFTGTYNVLQNFLTGYGVIFTPTACAGQVPPVVTATDLSVPAGCEIGVQFNATTAGNLGGDRRFRLEVIRGAFEFIDPITHLTGRTLEVTSSHEGRINAIIRTFSGVPTQLAVIRVTELTTFVHTDTTFTIRGATSSTTLRVIPDTFSFGGPDINTCGTGEADFFVFDGLPPYSASSSNPNLVVIPVSPNTNPGVFRVRAVNPFVCLTTVTVVITDAVGAVGTLTVTTTTGTGDPPPGPLTVSQNALTLACGEVASLLITGGSGTYAAALPTPTVPVVISAVVSGNFLTIGRTGPAGPGSGGPRTILVTLTDGAQSSTIAVTSPTNCP